MNVDGCSVDGVVAHQRLYLINRNVRFDEHTSERMTKRVWGYPVSVHTGFLHSSSNDMLNVSRRHPFRLTAPTVVRYDHRLISGRLPRGKVVPNGVAHIVCNWNDAILRRMALPLKLECRAIGSGGEVLNIQPRNLAAPETGEDHQDQNKHIAQSDTCRNINTSKQRLYLVIHQRTLIIELLPLDASDPIHYVALRTVNVEIPVEHSQNGDVAADGVRAPL